MDMLPCASGLRFVTMRPCAAVCAPIHHCGFATIMTSTFLHRLSVPGRCLTLLCAMPLLLAMSGQAMAQNITGRPSEAPPRMEPLPDDDQSGNAIRRPDSTRSTTDSRDHSGTVTETRVQTGVTTYYVRPNTSPGNAQPGDGQSSGNRAAQFKIGEFDLGRHKGAADNAEPTPQVLPPAALPPAVPAAR